MSCPNCNYIIDLIAKTGPARTYWCPQCGTIKGTISGTNTEAKKIPFLVKRLEKAINTDEPCDTHYIRECLDL